MRGPSLLFLTHRNKSRRNASECPIAFRTLLSWKMRQPPEAHEPERPQKPADRRRKKGQPSIRLGGDNKGNVYQLQSRSNKELISVPRYLSVFLLPYSVALEGENVPKIFRD